MVQKEENKTSKGTSEPSFLSPLQIYPLPSPAHIEKLSLSLGKKPGSSIVKYNTSNLPYRRPCVLGNTVMIISSFQLCVNKFLNKIRTVIVLHWSIVALGWSFGKLKYLQIVNSTSYLWKKLDSDLEEKRVSTKYFYRTVYKVKKCDRLKFHIFPPDTNTIQGWFSSKESALLQMVSWCPYHVNWAPHNQICHGPWNAFYLWNQPWDSFL